MGKENSAVSQSKIAIVTGGSRGLGRHTVVNLAMRGIDSIFTFHTNRLEADKVIKAVNEAGAKAIALQLDTGNVAAFDSFVKDLHLFSQLWAQNDSTTSSTMPALLSTKALNRPRSRNSTTFSMSISRASSF
jgi:short chain dehydrogenase